MEKWWFWHRLSEPMVAAERAFFRLAIYAACMLIVGQAVIGEVRARSAALVAAEIYQDTIADSCYHEDRVLSAELFAAWIGESARLAAALEEGLRLIETQDDLSTVDRQTLTSMRTAVEVASLNAEQVWWALYEAGVIPHVTRGSSARRAPGSIVPQPPSRLDEKDEGDEG